MEDKNSNSSHSSGNLRSQVREADSGRGVRHKMQAPGLAVCAWCSQAQHSRFRHHYLASVLSW